MSGRDTAGFFMMIAIPSLIMVGVIVAAIALWYFFGAVAIGYAVGAIAGGLLLVGLGALARSFLNGICKKKSTHHQKPSSLADKGKDKDTTSLVAKKISITVEKPESFKNQQTRKDPKTVENKTVELQQLIIPTPPPVNKPNEEKVENQESEFTLPTVS